MTIKELYKFFRRQTFYSRMGALNGQERDELVHIAVVGCYSFLESEKAKAMSHEEVCRLLNVKGRSAVIDYIRSFNHSRLRFEDYEDEGRIAKFVSLEMVAEKGDGLDRASEVNTALTVQARCDLQRVFDLAERVMTEAEYKAFVRYYLEGMDMKTVGDSMNVSETRVSQLINKGAGRLAMRMDGYQLQQGTGKVFQP